VRRARARLSWSGPAYSRVYKLRWRGETVYDMPMKERGEAEVPGWMKLAAEALDKYQPPSYGAAVAIVCWYRVYAAFKPQEITEAEVYRIIAGEVAKRLTA
jgi:hypothetical protein